MTTTATSQDDNSAIVVTAKMAKVYSPTIDLASAIGRKAVAVSSVPVSIGNAVDWKA